MGLRGCKRPTRRAGTGLREKAPHGGAHQSTRRVMRNVLVQVALFWTLPTCTCAHLLIRFVPTHLLISCAAVCFQQAWGISNDAPRHVGLCSAFRTEHITSS